MQLRKLLGRFLLAVGVSLAPTCVAVAEVTVPNIFSEHMVLQRDQKNRVWGKAAANEQVTVRSLDRRKALRPMPMACGKLSSTRCLRAVRTSC